VVNQVIIVVRRDHVFGRRKLSSVLGFYFWVSATGQDLLAAGVGGYEFGRVEASSGKVGHRARSRRGSLPVTGKAPGPVVILLKKEASASVGVSFKMKPQTAMDSSLLGH
jgi:hypothetical protein